eukprot:3609564-Pyramimonas_sp.AAC.1
MRVYFPSRPRSDASGRPYNAQEQMLSKSDSGRSWAGASLFRVDNTLSLIHISEPTRPEPI